MQIFGPSDTVKLSECWLVNVSVQWTHNEWNAEISDTGHLPRNAQPERQLEVDKCEMATTFTAIMELFRNHRNGLQINPNLIQFWIGCEEHGNFPKNVQSSRVRKLYKMEIFPEKLIFLKWRIFIFFIAGSRFVTVCFSHVISSFFKKKYFKEMNGALVSCSDYFRFPKRKTSQLHATNRLVEIMFF